MRLVYVAAFGVGLLWGALGERGALSLLLRGVEFVGQQIVALDDDDDDFVLVSCNGRQPKPYGADG